MNASNRRRKPHTLRSDAEYDAAEKRIDELLDMDPDPGTPEHEELDMLSVLVQHYDAEHFPVGPASPQEIVDQMLEQKGMTRADLAGPMGGRSRVSDFFNGKRGLSLRQIDTLREILGIPADLLIPRSAPHGNGATNLTSGSTRAISRKSSRL